MRANKIAQVVDISSSPPVVTDVANLSYDRIWGNATLLPDGEIIVTGGSGVSNELINVAYHAEIFNPSSGTWTLGASASIPRLYHSATLLLPDGSVLTGGGGSPGPSKRTQCGNLLPRLSLLERRLRKPRSAPDKSFPPRAR